MTTQTKVKKKIPIDHFTFVSIPSNFKCPARRWIINNVDTEYEDQTLDEDLFSLDWENDYDGDREIPEFVSVFMDDLRSTLCEKKIYANYVRFETS